jgi:hypothetical protein
MKSVYLYGLRLFEGFFTKNMKLEFEYPIKYLKIGFGIIPIIILIILKNFINIFFKIFAKKSRRLFCMDLMFYGYKAFRFLTFLSKNFYEECLF